MNNCLLSMFVSFLSNMGCLWKNFIVSFWASYWLISCFHFTNMSCRGQPRICFVAANTSAKGDHSGHCNISIRLMTLLTSFSTNSCSNGWLLWSRLSVKQFSARNFSCESSIGNNININADQAAESLKWVLQKYLVLVSRLDRSSIVVLI